jgi:hypothetical protein
MQIDGIAQLDKWKRAGVIADYRVLFTTFAGADTPDMYLIVRFNHLSDEETWQKIEEVHPGGLPPRAEPIATVQSTSPAAVLSEDHSLRSTSKSQFLMSQYDVLVDMPRYTSYFMGYAVPQFSEWEKAGILSSYESYVSQNPAGAPWGSLVLLEYKD